MAQPLSSAVPQVFEFLADPRNMPRWNSGVAEVDDRRIDAREGARYRYRFPGRRRFHHLTCSAYHAPFLLGFRGERMWTPLGTQTVAYTFRLRSADRGSTVVMSVDVSLCGGMLLLLPVVTLGWRRDLPIDLAKLRETLDPEEQRAAERGAYEPAGPEVSGQRETAVWTDAAWIDTAEAESARAESVPVEPGSEPAPAEPTEPVPFERPPRWYGPYAVPEPGRRRVV
ncbi:hypothetical protein AN216_09890 [Streptomyces oceani]|uniref:Polyketide cyclase n=2 Tax=Streptomyces oceani TaxID=1075402 RepID=A0A1E7KJB0_9ACTN|nr:hypothetical protein AN216_09890 [Streptomyces oceani]